MGFFNIFTEGAFGLLQYVFTEDAFEMPQRRLGRGNPDAELSKAEIRCGIPRPPIVEDGQRINFERFEFAPPLSAIFAFKKYTFLAGHLKYDNGHFLNENFYQTGLLGTCRVNKDRVKLRGIEIKMLFQLDALVLPVP